MNRVVSRIWSRGVPAIAAALLFVSPCALSAKKNIPADTVRLLLIGNSFSQNASRYLPSLAGESNHVLVIGRAEIGGCPLEKHWRLSQVYEQDTSDLSGKPYPGEKSLRMLLSERNWDVITLQQASVYSTDPTSYMPYAQQLYDYIRRFQPSARILMHQTWAYRSDAPGYGFLEGTNGKERAASDKQMWELSRAAYRSAAAKLGVQLIPVGDAFWKVCSDPKRGYRKDTVFDVKEACMPDLPDQTGSLHSGYYWDQAGVMKLDANHASNAGCYFGGLVWYGVLFGESPAKLKYIPEGVPASFAAYLRKTAEEVLIENKFVPAK